MVGSVGERRAKANSCLVSEFANGALQSMREGFAGLPEMAAVVRADNAESGISVVVHVGEGRLHFLLVDGFSRGGVQEFEQLLVQTLKFQQCGFRFDASDIGGLGQL